MKLNRQVCYYINFLLNVQQNKKLYVILRYSAFL
jgi:hypothetical protein